MTPVDGMINGYDYDYDYVLRGMAAGWSRGMCMFPTFRNPGFKPLHTHCVCMVGRNRKTRGAQRTWRTYPMGRNQKIQALKIGNQM